MTLDESDKIYVDTIEVLKIYIGTDLVYDSIPAVLEEYDQALLYDETNIATEFITWV